ncbi:MAG: hypothetical protein CSA35_05805 [Dethiosulfovibrio peptidovorans]|nr:MAG: hypothetical protein CSA35_05805 [Dethiosulfovibrio peptidovorans]
MKRRIWSAAMMVCLVVLGGALPASARYMLVGIDGKVTWNEQGVMESLPPGADKIQIFDIAKGGTEPQQVTVLELSNSIYGPPTNMAITKDERLALVANSVEWVQKDGKWTASPGREIYVIDMEATPPKRIATVTGDLQPSGMAVNRAGTLALVANRKGHSVTVFSIEGKSVSLVGTVSMGDEVAAVSISPDGSKAWVVKNKAHKLALLSIEGTKVAPTGFEIPVLWPYNVDMTPDGALAFCCDMGGPGGSSGHVDTVSVIDMTQNPPRVVDRVVTGDGPEGFAVSPDGSYLATVNIRGSNVDHGSWLYHKKGTVSLLKIDGKSLTKVDEVEVEAMPEGVVWSPDGVWMYVGNFLDKNMSVLKVEEGRLVNTGKTIPLAGGPASMCGPVK